MKFFFGTDDLDVRNWAADYGGLKELKKTLEDQFDHTLLVAQDDPELATFKLLQEKKMAKLTVLPRLGCEGLSDMLYKYVNGVYIPDLCGDQVKPNVYGAIVWKYVKHRPTWRSVKVIVNGMRICLHNGDVNERT
jgi:6-pyruvoyl-tetrahydropterin synthase